MRKIALSVLVLMFVSLFAFAALAADEEAVDSSSSTSVQEGFDFLRFAKEVVLTNFHPTAKADDAEVEFDKEPETTDGVSSARVKIFYKGWIRKHEMNTEIDYRADGGLIKVTVKSDTNGMSNLVGNKFKENTWVELSSLDWK